MNKRTKESHQAPVIMFVAAAAFVSVMANLLGATDIYRARMLTGRAPVEPPAVNVRIEIQDYTTADEVMSLQEALNQGGNDGFLKAFQGMKKGVVRIMDRRGWNLTIHAVQLIPAEKGTQLLCFMMRQAWDPGTQFGRTGADFFMVLELNLNEKGRGEGRLYEDAGINLRPLAGRIEMSRYGSAPKILVQASAEKKKS